MSFAVLVAGGTGGHINAALALGEKLKDQSFEVIYLTGKRHLDFKLFSGQPVKHLDSKPLRTNNPLELLKNFFLNIYSFLSILIFFVRKRPQFIIGAGGYVCGPTLLAGFLLFIPVFIIEQNAVMGLTNRILGWISSKIFVHFTETKGLSKNLEKKVLVVGNPTRKSIRPVVQKKRSGPLKVLVFGGSLGAKQINEIIWDILKENLPYEVEIHHQVGADQKAPEITTQVKYFPMTYIDNIQEQYDWCDVIISRSGASTISELAIIRKPVLIIPFPKATDNHQFLNAMIFKKESDFTVEVLDPKTAHESCVHLVKEFLFKAHQESLNYSKKPIIENNTCDQILREIQSNVRLA
jgi:UDP-N-acetylglucosamine--N-acetylmuramyl-(pentapeptide) pyrophosphoryl-undecaprenol N-acetylglucosamine transferase